VETAAAVEIDKGGLRQYVLDDFHRCLEKACAKNASAFPTVPTGPTAIQQLTSIITYFPCLTDGVQSNVPNRRLAITNWRSLSVMYVIAGREAVYR